MADRTEPDILDIPLSRRDALDILHELSKARGPIVGQMEGGFIEQESQAALHANALWQHFRAKWEKPSQPEKP